MAQTLEILESVRSRLQNLNPDLVVEFFPDSPDEYRLNHPKGSLLISYPGGMFGESLDSGIVVQDRAVRIGITTVFRQLNGRDGAVHRLDLLRLHLVGFQPDHCGKLRAIQEKFLQEKTGVWYYITLFEAHSMQVEDTEQQNGPLATQLNYYDPLDEVGTDVPRAQVPRP